jgi:ABC-type multidrug transport system permease subunit
VWGVVTLGYSISWGSMEPFHDLFNEAQDAEKRASTLLGYSGVDIEKYSEGIGEVFEPLALFFLLIGMILLFFSVGGFLTLFCKNCLCTCLYGTCLSIFSFLVVLLGIILLAVVMISNSVIDNYCA